MNSTDPAAPVAIQQKIGIGGAIFLGLGSIVGSGVFVSIGLAAEIAGPAVLVALAVAALIAICNGLSSAQLAANHPVSGGTYEYGYRYLSPAWGFAAGWLFLCAKSASAATAALGAATYLLRLVKPDHVEAYGVVLALVFVVLLTGLTLSGIRRSSHVNTAIVSVTLASLLIFVLTVLSQRGSDFSSARLLPSTNDLFAGGNWRTLGEAIALLFVAYTGYGRVATLGEEIHEPRKNIPRAVIITLVVSFAIYLAVTVVCLLVIGSEGHLSFAAAGGSYLIAVANSLDVHWLSVLISIGAATAMLGVLLNLILGLSRVVLAMGRRGDLPVRLASLNADQSSPTLAVLFVGVVTAGLVCLGNVKTTWSFSAVTVLVYYAITNLCALRLPRADSLYLTGFSWCGLIACLLVGLCVPVAYLVAGAALLVIGFVLRAIVHHLRCR